MLLDADCLTPLASMCFASFDFSIFLLIYFYVFFSYIPVVGRLAEAEV